MVQRGATGSRTQAPDLSALSPEQALDILHSQQSLYQVLGQLATPIAQERRLAREAELASRANAVKAAQTEEALTALSQFNASNILSAPADVLAKVSPKLVDSVIDAAVREKLQRIKGAQAEAAEKRKGPQQTEQIITANYLNNEKKQLGLQNVEDTPTFQTMVTAYQALHPEKSPEDARKKFQQQVVLSITKNPAAALKSSEVINQMADDFTKHIYPSENGELHPIGEEKSTISSQLSVNAWKERYGKIQNKVGE